MRRPAPPSRWPPGRPKRLALATVLVVLAGGLAAIIATGSSVAHVGTLLIGCVALGTILASVLDRRRAPD